MGNTDTKKNIFVVGLDDFNHEILKTVKGAEHYRFHRLMTRQQLQGPDRVPVDKVLRRCREKLTQFEGKIDAIMGYWDFPVTDIVPLLCREFNLPSSPFEGVLKCEHKYWGRLEQQKVVPEVIPAFQPIDPFDESALDKVDLPYPFWIKPIRATASQMAYKVHNRKQLEKCLLEIRDQIDRFAKPFNYLMGLGNVPAEIAAIDGRHCLAEGTISGKQCTVEGHVYNGEIHTHGVVDSFRYPGVSSFFRYQYPSQLPPKIKAQLIDLTTKTIAQTGLDNSTFNVEFFVEKETGNIGLLEVNPRISQSHSDIFRKVDGASNFDVMVPLALGEKPDFPSREGKYKCAAKFFLRVFEDTKVLRVPDESEIKQVKKRFPDTHVTISVKAGDRLSDLSGQDSYSYSIANLFIGAKNTQELLQKFRDCRDMLPFNFSNSQLKVAPLRGDKIDLPTRDAS
ncbi:MAG TPA: ATP-grasp domain-containing protein [Opitutales bacterium]|nr:ATP-grasp domain-containing protein [Opitutales bacterium]